MNEQDVGGQERIRPLWRHYFVGTEALIFVVDSTDEDRMEEAKSELHRILDDRDMLSVIVAIFANKQALTLRFHSTKITDCSVIRLLLSTDYRLDSRKCTCIPSSKEI